MDSNVINVSSEVRVTFVLVLNTSFSWLERPTKSILTSHLATCIFLSLLALAAFLLNLCVLLAIFCSSSLKKVVLNKLVSYMSITCLLDCAVNIPFSLYYMKNNTWLLGPVWCTLNATCTIVITLLIAWILCYMCIERYLSLYKICQTKRCTLFCKQSVAIAFTVAIIFSVVFPVAVGLIEVRAFPSRYSCCVAVSKEIYYGVIIIISFVLPVFISVMSLLCAYAKNFQGIKDINGQRIELSYTELFFEESHLWNEWQTSKFVGFIMMLFIILELPAIITFMKPTTTPLRKTYMNNLEQHNSTIQVSFPVAQITPSFEKTYMWCKFTFCLAFPLVTLILRKEIRRKINVILSLFRKSSSLPKSNSIESPVSPEECPDDFLVPQVWRRRRLSSVTSLKSPIIFGKSRNVNNQFMDLTTGIARWKAKYEDPKNNKINKPFFAEVFDDEEEFTEFVSFQDLTEEELNSSELVAIPSTSKDVAVQTTQRQLLRQTSVESCYNISDTNVQYRCVFDGRLDKGRTRRNSRQSRSFTCNRVTNNYVKYKYYMTFPKISRSPGFEKETRVTSGTSDLLRALEVKRTNKNGATTCDLIPRGTAELLDSPVESRDIVSL